MTERHSRWRLCPACGHERKANAAGMLLRHNRWDPDLAAMTWCPGSGLRGAEPEPEDEQETA